MKTELANASRLEACGEMKPAAEINRIIVRQLERHKQKYECDFDLMLEVGCLCAVVFRGLAECQKHGEEI